ncbi:MAG: signal peptidase I [Flavobacterium sp.]|nr:signal peptidase I [Flavobacterium sp.]
MTLYQWFIFFLIVQVIHFAGTWKMYEAAGRKRWEAAVPVYNAYVLMKIINRPGWWVILLFVPIVNLIMFPVVWVELLRSFGKNTTTDTLLGIFTAGFYVYYVNYTQELNYVPDRSIVPQSKSGDTISSILFAIIVATIVHTYIMQPFTIPTSSLEKSLLVGDFLFVSKFHYGARTPKTAVAFPMVHDTIPILNIKSYTDWPQLPSFRFPGLEEISRNDIVVFNWPADTVRYFRDQHSVGIRKPVDKKSNYVKRCVGVPGDSLSIKDGIIHINGKVLQLPMRAEPQYSYEVTTNGSMLDPTYLLKELNITDQYYTGQNIYQFRALTETSVERLRNNPVVTDVKRIIATQGESNIFSGTSGWNLDNMGPIYIPEKGKTIAIDASSIRFYKKIIGEYEKNDLQINGNQIKINGKVATSYTFKQNYYWMMGDNRHNSEDSRYWGYVPEDHVVGKPVFVFMSWNQTASGLDKVRWDRVFTTVSGEGQRVSYLKHFLIALALYFGISYLVKKRREKRLNP